MTTKPYKNKKGKPRLKPILTEAEYFAYSDNSGFCVNCGDIADCVEPDAHHYKCSACEQRTVFGFQELLLMNLVEITT